MHDVGSKRLAVVVGSGIGGLACGAALARTRGDGPGTALRGLEDTVALALATHLAEIVYSHIPSKAAATFLGLAACSTVVLGRLSTKR